MSAAPRVLMVAAAHATSGGGEKHVADLLRELSGAGYALGLAAPSGGDLGALAGALGVPTFASPIDAGFSVGRVRGVREAIREFQPDIVHAHGSRAALFARLADPRASERVVYTVHGIHVDRSGGAMRRTVLLNTERLLRTKTARFVTVCEADLRRGVALRILDHALSRVVYNGIALPQPPGASGAFRSELGIGPDAPLILCVGRLEAQKDHATLIAAFERVHAQRPDAVLVLVGSGALEDQVRAQVGSLGLSDCVRIAPPRSRIADAYTDATVVALSSRWEGLPYTVVEAMAYGKPVVATCVDGIPEAVESGVTGLLVDPGDSEALAVALGDVLGDPAKAARMGAAGSARVVERFSVEQMVESLRSVYAEVMGQ